MPRAAWVSIPMTPIGDELFMDWPFMKQMDAIIWAYAPLVGIPPEDTIAFQASVMRRKGLNIAVVRRAANVYPRALALARRGAVQPLQMQQVTAAIDDGNRHGPFVAQGFGFGRGGDGFDVGEFKGVGVLHGGVASGS